MFHNLPESNTYCINFVKLNDSVSPNSFYLQRHNSLKDEDLRRFLLSKHEIKDEYCCHKVDAIDFERFVQHDNNFLSYYENFKSIKTNPISYLIIYKTLDDINKHFPLEDVVNYINNNFLKHLKYYDFQKTNALLKDNFSISSVDDKKLIIDQYKYNDYSKYSDLINNFVNIDNPACLYNCLLIIKYLDVYVQKYIKYLKRLPKNDCTKYENEYKKYMSLPDSEKGHFHKYNIIYYSLAEIVIPYLEYLKIHIKTYTDKIEDVLNDSDKYILNGLYKKCFGEMNVNWKFSSYKTIISYSLTNQHNECVENICNELNHKQLKILEQNLKYFHDVNSTNIISVDDAAINYNNYCCKNCSLYVWLKSTFKFFERL